MSLFSPSLDWQSNILTKATVSKFGPILVTYLPSVDIITLPVWYIILCIQILSGWNYNIQVHHDQLISHGSVRCLACVRLVLLISLQIWGSLYLPKIATRVTFVTEAAKGGLTGKIYGKSSSFFSLLLSRFDQCLSRESTLFVANQVISEN